MNLPFNFFFTTLRAIEKVLESNSKVFLEFKTKSRKLSSDSWNRRETISKTPRVTRCKNAPNRRDNEQCARHRLRRLAWHFQRLFVTKCWIKIIIFVWTMQAWKMLIRAASGLLVSCLHSHQVQFSHQKSSSLMRYRPSKIALHSM